MLDDEQALVPPTVSPPRDQSTADKPATVEAESALVGIPHGEISQYPLTVAVKAISDFGIKGQSAMVLLLASASRLETDLLHERNETQRLRDHAQAIRDEYHEVKEQLAVANERLLSTRRIRTLQNVLLTLGGLCLATGARMILQEFTGTSFLFALFGVLLLLFGWLWPTQQAKEAKS